MLIRSLLTLLINISIVQHYAAAQTTAPSFDRAKDVIYGRSWGTSLTMDVFTPPKAKRNGIGLIWVVSGGWYSAPEAINGMTMNWFLNPMIDRGYTVFAVCHGSAPRFTIPEAINDVNRAVRYIRYHANDYNIDPDRIGIFGGSAGGHLSVSQGVNPLPPNEKSPDPVDKTPSNVQAVGCFFPPTDFLNYGEEGKLAVGAGGLLLPFQASFDYRTFDDKSRKFVTVTDDAKIREITRAISPLYHVDPKDPPILIIHGDADVLVPYEQATRIIKKLEEAGVPNKLVTKPAAGHGWTDIHKDTPAITDWFDAQLLKTTPATTQATTQASADK
jgi:acetyl esterase/lipase